VCYYLLLRLYKLPVICTGVVNDLSKQRLIQAHGMMMIIGWWTFSALAIILARYYRQTWPTLKIADKDIWFQVLICYCFYYSTIHYLQAHRALNITGMALVIAATVCIFVAAGWDIDSTSDNYIHRILGCICICLGLFQPLNSFLRCHPGTRNRWIFNWAHRLVGLSAWSVGSE
jgi:hypothetical protein